MNYPFYIVIFCSVSFLILVWRWFKYHLKFDFLTKLVLKNNLTVSPQFFSSFCIREIIYKAIQRRQTTLIDFLLAGKRKKALPLVKDKNLALILKGFDMPQRAAEMMLKTYKKSHSNTLAVWCALLFSAAGDKKKASSCWDNAKEKGLPPYLKACYFCHMAQTAAQNGDLESASAYFYRAISRFRRTQAYYEEAQTYLNLATLYRICFIFDTAESLLRTSKDIFGHIGHETGLAQVHAQLGMLMIGQERFEEALDYFNRSLQFYEAKKHLVESAEIKNQLALLYLLQRKFSLAQGFLRQAKKIHKTAGNIIGEAFSTELEANCFWLKENFAQTQKSAERAAQLYEKTDNVSGLLESLYLLAQALFKQEKDNEAEILLRKIIDIGKKDCGCFYLANAYNLLGIIYVKRKDLLRAKGLFRQSLELEQRGFRSKALAADYTNLGIIDLRCGQPETAKKNLEAALELAESTEDEELCAQIKQLLNQLNN